MEPIVGKINKYSKNWVQWDVMWSSVKSYRKNSNCRIRSPSFRLSTGTYCFTMQLKLPCENFKIEYITKVLQLTSTPSSRSMKKLYMCTNTYMYMESEINEEPQLLFETSGFTKRYFLYIDLELVSGESDSPSIEVPKDQTNDVSRNTESQEPPRSKSSKITQTDASIESEVQESFESKSTDKLVGDLKELLLCRNGSDVVLKVEDKEFKAHRLILGMRTPVFSAMFEHEMKEKNSGVVIIEDCDQETFPDLLHYIYTGTVEEFSSKKVSRLYVAADKYQLLELKEECLKYMKNNVSVDTFCDFMGTSLRHCEEELTRIATDFFVENASDIVVTVEWMKFLSQNVIAGNELIIKLSENMKKQ